MLCELSLLINKKEGVEEQFPEVVGNSHCEKLWNHLDQSEFRDFRSTKEILNKLVRLKQIKIKFYGIRGKSSNLNCTLRRRRIRFRPHCDKTKTHHINFECIPQRAFFHFPSMDNSSLGSIS